MSANTSNLRNQYTYLLLAELEVRTLRTFAPKNFPHTDFFKTLTDGRKW